MDMDPQQREDQQFGSFITGSPTATQDEKTMGMLSHLGAIAGLVVGAGFLGWAVPLFLMLTKGKESSFVRGNAVESLNFQITTLIAMFVSGILMCVGVGFILVPVVALASLVFSVIGGIKANEGQLYRYPVNLRLVK
ncbi:DUF4870 domain-containing protein [Corallococcus caeni]|uniref:DUF4870 domain-containing protein n=2 Tax=Corallococcus TaxID=83461 RepID=A0A7Y4JN95_9BACT|nr:DUF4870 domain-containing protein [Corallococcus exercitus]NOK08135.1 DUF4870 domain-containing protein [Corallococcus exercitus]GMT98806.1 DUF4870 domain-containing protein [Corallococcus sp. KH5-1]GMU06078.1 DUF4870 domain-containing protein [Corallococcus sp. NO1]